MEIKIKFLLKTSNNSIKKLENINISTPKIKKITNYNGRKYYACEVYLSTSKEKNYLIYGINPVDALCLVSEFVKTHLQLLIKRGCSIIELENKEPWKLEKLSDNFLSEKIEAIKNNPNLSSEEKSKILTIIKESFGTPNSPIKDQVNKLID